MTTSSTIHSAAFNFLSHAKTGVDPRTGQYTCTLSLPDLNANDLAGPALSLSLGFSPLNNVDSGFGAGWTLQLSQYDTLTNILSLSTGETFKVTGTSGDQLVMQEKKLDSFHLHKLSEERFRVVHNSGLVEELSKISGSSLALPDTIYSAQGRLLRLTYVPFAGERLLKSIAQADGTVLLDITRQTGSLSVRLHPNMPYEVLFRLVIEGSEQRVVRIELPDDDSTTPPTDGGSWRFTYERLEEDFLCINRVEGPLGGFETILYDGIPHFFPGTENRRLPRVARHIHNPGVTSGQPPIETRYEYSDNNFLGRNAPGLSWDNDGLDNLYKVLSNYLYDSTEELWDAANNKALRSTKRIFNRFHLMTSEETEQGDCVKQVVTDYYAEDGKPFKEQVAYCQMPQTVTTTWWRKSDPPRKRIETVSNEYDFHGNPTVTVQANGIREESTYYPADGADGCPPDPYGFVRHLKDKTVIPADAEYGDAPVLRTVHRYTSLPPVDGGSEPWLALEQETLVQVENNDDVELQRTLNHYMIQPADSFQHCRIAKTEVVINGLRTYTDFFYSKTAATRSSETVLRTVELLSTSFDQVKKTVTREQSLLNGQPLLERDDNDVEIAYRYDKLGRVVEETAAPGTQWSATRTYEYLLVNRPDQQASQTATDVKGVKTFSLLDGLKRVVKEERQDVDGNPVTKPFRPVYEATYNAFGQMTDSAEFDWLREQNLRLPSSYTYDEWGEQYSVTGPDGVTEYRELTHSMTAPIRLEVHEWRDGMGKTVTRHNLFEKPDTIERFDLAGRSISEKSYFYDGLGRTHHEFDELDHFRFFEYDAHGRMTLSGLPDNAEVERRYAEHSTEDLPVWIGVNGVLLGEQTFDGLERLSSSTTGGRLRQYLFDDGRQQPTQVITPAGKAIDYEYNLHLGEEPTLRRTPGSTAEYAYDRENARLTFSSENDQSLTCTYYSNGELKTEDRTTQDGQQHHMAYVYSLQGRLLSYTDVFGQEQTCEYDLHGRLHSTVLGGTTSTFAYNASGQTSSITTVDSTEGNSVRIDLEYDDLGREFLRTFTFDDATVQTLEQGYNARDMLEWRTLTQGSELLRHETYGYDERGRLDDYQCSGSEPPLDPYGHAINQQLFVFDALDNLIEVTTVFPGGTNIATHDYDNPLDPTQLTRVSNTHDDYPEVIDLNYDADGNLVSDEQGRTLAYDELGRLHSVEEAGSATTHYRYDAQDVLSGSLGEEGDEQRFYRDGELASQLHDGVQRSFLRGDSHVLAELVSGAEAQSRVVATDVKKTVLAERNATTVGLAYTAHGYRSASAQALGRTGFNGEHLETSGVYLLGSYRAYNPTLMIFHSPDSFSPFGDGGLNGYAYVLGDPVNLEDPTGHLPMWAASLLGFVGGAVLFGVGSFALGITLSAAAAVAVQATAIVTTAVGMGSTVASLVVKEGGLKDVLGWVGFGSSVVGGAAFGLAVGTTFAASAAAKATTTSKAAAPSNAAVVPKSPVAPKTPSPASSQASSQAAVGKTKMPPDPYFSRAKALHTTSRTYVGNANNPPGLGSIQHGGKPLVQVKATELRAIDLRGSLLRGPARGNLPY